MNIEKTRKELRLRRKQLTFDDRESASLKIAKNLVSSGILSDSKNIATYLQNDGEVDPIYISKDYVFKSCKFYIPIINDQNKRTLKFGEYDQNQQFEKNKYGINEPINPSLVSIDVLDAVLFPLVGFDRNGNRIGMGGGFYDKTFEFVATKKKNKLKLIGLGFSIQETSNIPNRAWDLPLQYIVTEKEFICVEQK